MPNRRTFLKYTVGAGVLGTAACDGAPPEEADSALGGLGGTPPSAKASSEGGAGGENEPDVTPEKEQRLLPNRPNVIWISADDLGARLGTYGDTRAITPHMDAFSRRALTFERAYCQVAICSASRTSILTGVRPSTSGLTGLYHDWAATMPEVTSLPRHLRDHGYFTHGVGKIFDARSGPGDEPWDAEHVDGRFADEDIAVNVLRQRSEAQNQDAKPFFLAIGFSAPHCPWNPTESSLALHADRHAKLQGSGRNLDRESQLTCYDVDQLELSDKEARDITIRYYATVTDLDEKIGRITEEIEELGLFESSVVIIWCGDHGFQLGESDWYGKWSNYDASTRIPLLLHVPGETIAATRTPRLVECVDMYPSLLDILDLPQPNHELEGASFAPLIANPDRSWKRAVFTQWSKKVLSIKTESYNYIRTENSDASFSHQLFDLESDPKEEHNLSVELPDEVSRLGKILDEGWKASLPP